MAIARVQRKTSNAAVQEKLSYLSQESNSQDSAQLQQLEEPKLELLTDVHYLEQRNKQIKKIEQDVCEIADLYKSINQLVDEQQPQIDEIEKNIIKAKDNVEGGQEELEKADRYLRNRCVIL